MKDCNCGYCMGGDILAGFGIKICDLQGSQLILFKEQSHPGRVIVAYKDHVSELVDISPEERAAFFEDVAKAAAAIHKNQDIEGDEYIFEKIENRMKIAETDEGRQLQTQVNDLMDLLEAYRSGAVLENHED